MTFLLRRIPGTSRSVLLYGISLLISHLHHLRKHRQMPSSSSLWGENGLISGCLLFASVHPKKHETLMLQLSVLAPLMNFRPSHHSAPSLHPKCTCRPYVSGDGCNVVYEEWHLKWQWQSQSNNKIEESQDVLKVNPFSLSKFTSANCEITNKTSLRKLWRSQIFKKTIVA